MYFNMHVGKVSHCQGQGGILLQTLRQGASPGIVQRRPELHGAFQNIYCVASTSRLLPISVVTDRKALVSLTASTIIRIRR